jgi:hypothetical protein
MHAMAPDQEQTRRLLARTLVHTGEVLAHLTHPQLARSLQDTLEGLLRSACRDESDVETLADAAQSLRRELEGISVVSGAPLASLLVAERHVLLLQLHLGTSRTQGAQQAKRRASLSVPRIMSTRPKVSANIRESMEQVLGYVRTTGPSQARDIISGCAPVLSERTVKRRIKDLVRDGKLRKEEADGTLLYRAVG